MTDGDELQHRDALEVARPLGALGCAYIRETLQGLPGLPPLLLDRMSGGADACYAPLLPDAPQSATVNFEVGGINSYTTGDFLERDLAQNAQSVAFLDLWASPSDLQASAHEEIRAFKFEGGVGLLLRRAHVQQFFWLAVRRLISFKYAIVLSSFDNPEPICTDDVLSSDVAHKLVEGAFAIYVSAYDGEAWVMWRDPSAPQPI